MRRSFSRLALAGVLSLAAGCTSSITNLTPTAVPRTTTRLYHFESEWTTTQRSVVVRPDQIRAFVVVDQKAYPMERVPRMTNRWEAEVPLPADKNPIFYFYKWDYATATLSRDQPNSRRSPTYRLELVNGAGEPGK